MAAMRQFRNGPSQAVRSAAELANARRDLELEIEPVGVELIAAQAPQLALELLTALAGPGQSITAMGRRIIPGLPWLQ